MIGKFGLSLHTLILLFLCVSSNAQQLNRIPYRNDPAISNEQGVPRDSTTFYFPIELFKDSIHYLRFFDPKRKKIEWSTTGPGLALKDEQEKICRGYKIERFEISDSLRCYTDTFSLKCFSFDLYKMQEPVLSNYYSGKETYRFTWLRSFDRPVVIRFDKSDTTIVITTKELKSQVPLPFLGIMGTHLDEEGVTIIEKREFNIPYYINKTRRLPTVEYTEVTKMIDSLKLLELPPRLVTMGCDGAEWILEISNSKGYFYIQRWAPQVGDPVREIGEYMIESSDLKKERIY